MNKLFYTFCVVTILNLTACGQGKSNNTKAQEKTNTSKSINMDTSKLTNEIVKQTIEALQTNDKNTFYNHFTADAVFTDDGNKMDFKKFFDNAFNHKEKFLTFDKVENEGKDITGDFFAGQWGTFKVFFKFHINNEEKITRLDIGQVK